MDEKFWGDHHNVFVVMFSLVVYKGSGEEVCGSVCFTQGVFYFVPVVFQDCVPSGQSLVKFLRGLPEH